MKGHRITFSGQILNYQTTVAQLVELLGDENAASDLRCWVLFQLAGSHYDQKIEHMYEIAVFLATGKEVSKGQTKSWRKKELLPLNPTSNTLSSPGDEFWLRKSDESSQSSQDDAETS
ncbi:hypothetical protein IGI04_015230 [Brassica rapa subsp. trilocularis]|uniref:Uncharacterized protein n=1 Tax=Brassica rapa subsp. trilocularis TaxID=1813537 RepID=A0ABQ7MPF4_BRACM|nr:hypothetical protein IGI04_015230 [Brassica rapa subsp. trilocularis]